MHTLASTVFAHKMRIIISSMHNFFGDYHNIIPPRPPATVSVCRPSYLHPSLSMRAILVRLRRRASCGVKNCKVL
jgi:hypothetical protein